MAAHTSTRFDLAILWRFDGFFVMYIVAAGTTRTRTLIMRDNNARYDVPVMYVCIAHGHSHMHAMRT